MFLSKKDFTAGLIFWCVMSVPVSVLAEQMEYNADRGQLLYSLHCASCHDTEVHWREKKLATNWPALLEQVGRWQKNLSLEWNDSDIDDVAGYLNATYYHFPIYTGKALSENDTALPGGARN